MEFLEAARLASYFRQTVPLQETLEFGIEIADRLAGHVNGGGGGVQGGGGGGGGGGIITVTSTGERVLDETGTQRFRFWSGEIDRGRSPRTSLEFFATPLQPRAGWITSWAKRWGAHYIPGAGARRKQLDGASRLFSFGVVLYQMATGLCPPQDDQK